MKLHTILLSAVLAMVALWAPHSADAVSPFIPSAAYPPGAHITFRPHLTNTEMDCMWGFLCEAGGVPNFHLRTQDDLGRLGGWGQFAGIERGNRAVMAFELFVSRYNPLPDDTGMRASKEAFLDLELALRGQGYRLNRHAARLIPLAPGGGTLTAVQSLGKQDLVVMACWSGAVEIEGIALYNHRPPSARWTAWTSLSLQIGMAWAHGQ